MIHDWRGAPVSTQQLARWQTAPQPVETGFMNADMRALWERMRGTDAAPRLYGGTALALYINHRRSTDFDFATTALAVPGELDLLALGPPARTTGRAGMVTAWTTTRGAAGTTRGGAKRSRTTPHGANARRVHPPDTPRPITPRLRSNQGRKNRGAYRPTAGPCAARDTRNDRTTPSLGPHV